MTMFPSQNSDGYHTDVLENRELQSTDVVALNGMIFVLSFMKVH